MRQHKKRKFTNVIKVIVKRNVQMKNVFECKIQKKSKELNCMTVGSLKEEVYKG